MEEVSMEEVVDLGLGGTDGSILAATAAVALIFFGRRGLSPSNLSNGDGALVFFILSLITGEEVIDDLDVPILTELRSAEESSYKSLFVSILAEFFLDLLPCLRISSSTSF